jgi:hypothetical protein
MKPDPLAEALRGAHHRPAPPPRAPDFALVVGAGGTLGSALLAEALGTGGFGRVAALVRGPITSTMRGMVPLAEAALGRGDAAAAMLALVVFERERHANGRDEAFVRPDPHALPALAQTLHAAGVRRLVVVLPHAPALLPQALKAGFASHDEQAVAALDFEQLVFVRAAQDAGAAVAAPSRIERFAAWWVSQLRWMVPQREQALRAVVLARVVVQLARALRTAPPGTRVAPPELLWQAAQPEADAAALFEAWLQGAPGAPQPAPSVPAPGPRR